MTQFQQQLEAIYYKPFNAANMDTETRLLDELHTLWLREELHWKQYSCVQWLWKGDRNTHFFHLSAIQRQ